MLADVAERSQGKRMFISLRAYRKCAFWYHGDIIKRVYVAFAEITEVCMLMSRSDNRESEC